MRFRRSFSFIHFIGRKCRWSRLFLAKSHNYGTVQKLEILFNCYYSVYLQYWVHLCWWLFHWFSYTFGVFLLYLIISMIIITMSIIRWLQWVQFVLGTTLIFHPLILLLAVLSPCSAYQILEWSVTIKIYNVPLLLGGFIMLVKKSWIFWRAAYNIKQHIIIKARNVCEHSIFFNYWTQIDLCGPWTFFWDR